MKLWILLTIVLGILTGSAWACDPPRPSGEYLPAVRMVLLRSLLENTPADARSEPDTMYVALVGEQDPPAELLQNLRSADLVLEPWSKHPGNWAPNNAGFTFFEFPSQDTLKTQFKWMRARHEKPGGTVYGGADATVIRKGDAWEILAWNDLGGNDK
ncbi:MAG TPA: hypothetical protein VGL38_04900 [bacterium]|jgi:hypothetical protein